MRSAIAFSLSLLALASAAPSSPGKVTVQLSNDVSGANGDASIPLDGRPVDIGQAFGHSNLFKNGKLLVTSIFFVANFQNVDCVVVRNRVQQVANIFNPSKDFERFAQQPVDWEHGFTIACTKH
ncbi:hypothetical protein TGAM01_v202977 [Trichoderma gamsii]|uniref:Uncharacterized protein n=1 Tax=Trichoderma gamsii TaxID=398673 RepID=A0A0W7W4F1_9HYPO|nr:hypothetical protein TGAM01_v202977 [Trichoderma gamsii]PNP44747.1 hypothetical protein TGAMA5MH_03556 [Trichoderma gamsii]PON28483.1 hypothetical protein TGAM01_v202977 [Trichoderma gamsii]